MLSIQIDKVLRRGEATALKYLGCFPSDRIPPYSTNTFIYPHCMVVNMDISTKAGSHWVALYMESPAKVDYYDSLGDWPPPSKHIQKYLNNFSIIRYNHMQLQTDDAATCGRHAIYFLWKRCTGEFCSIENMIKHFSSCQSKPDRLVYAFVHHLLKMHK